MKIFVKVTESLASVSFDVVALLWERVSASQFKTFQTSSHNIGNARLS